MKEKELGEDEINKWGRNGKVNAKERQREMRKAGNRIKMPGLNEGRAKRN